jgi:hypothetical protein
VKLIVGRNVPRGTGHYVRHVGEARSWQADADLAVERDAADWLVRDLIDIAAGRIARVRVEPAGAAPIEIVPAAPVASPAAAAAGDFVLANLPRGREPASEFVADAMAGLLSGLRFDDVGKPGELPPPAESVTRAEFLTREGVTVTLQAWGEGEKTQARFAATLDEAAAQAWAAAEQAKAVREHEALVAAAAKPAPTPAAADGNDAATAEAPVPAAAPAAPLAVTDPAKDREQRLEALRTEVATLNARFAERSFVLPPFKATHLGKKLEDYLKPKA